MCAECSPWSVVSIPWPQILSPGFLSLSLSLNAGRSRLLGTLMPISPLPAPGSGHWSQLILMFLSVITRGFIQMKGVNHHPPIIIIRVPGTDPWSASIPLCESTCPPWSLPSCVDYWLVSCLCNVHHPHLSPEFGLHIISAWENFITSSAQCSLPTICDID